LSVLIEPKSSQALSLERNVWRSKKRYSLRTIKTKKIKIIAETNLSLRRKIICRTDVGSEQSYHFTWTR